MKFKLIILLLLFPLCATGQEYPNEKPHYESKFFCSSQDRFLSDEDFIRLALGYELGKQRGGYRQDTPPPEGYEIESVDAFLENNPDSFSVTRDPKYMRNQGSSWMARLEDWLDGEQIAIWLLIPSDTIGDPMLVLTYFTDECGKINRDRSFIVSNDHITK